MKLLIIGSRTITNFDLTGHVPEETSLIISGGAKGVDTIAEQYADSHGIEKLIIKPQYEKFGRAAPIKRNEEMVELADTVLAIWGRQVERNKIYRRLCSEKRQKDN